MTIQEKLHIIKKSRLKPEERFLYPIFWQLKPYYSDNYEDIIFYKKDNEVLFEYDKKDGDLWCRHDKIWTVLESEHNQKIEIIRGYIRDIALKTINIKPTRISSSSPNTVCDLWCGLKLKEID